VGRTILSARVITDGIRLYNEANEFWSSASPVQRNRLRGFSMPLLAVAVHELALLTQFEARHAGREDAAFLERLVTERSAESAWKPSIDLRDIAAGALRAAAVHDDKLLAAVEVAKGTAEDGEKLSRREGCSIAAAARRKRLCRLPTKTSSRCRNRPDLPASPSGTRTRWIGHSHDSSQSMADRSALSRARKKPRITHRNPA
jgi:hypothetical protein